MMGLRGPAPRRVVDLSTGEVFESVAAAARHHYVTQAAIYYAIRSGSRCLNRRWAYAREVVA